MRIASAAAATISLALAMHASAQWQKVPDKNVPIEAGKPNLAARAPRVNRSTPDLSGVWFPDPDPNGKPGGLEQIVFPRYFVNVTADYQPGAVVLQPEADATFKKRLASEGKDQPAAYCKPDGAPAINSAPLPFKIVQTPKLVMILYESNTDFRQVFLDGRKPVEDPLPRWMGYSTGRWDGDTLVVDTVGFNEKTELQGFRHTEALHMVERFRRTDFDVIQYEVTIDDPNVFEKPYTLARTFGLRADLKRIDEFICENNRDYRPLFGR
jgi:hypothetical protein